MIDKVGGIILKDKKILVQRKNNNREECIIPGGKREGNETDFETLKRELKEELGLDISKENLIPFAEREFTIQDSNSHVTYFYYVKSNQKSNEFIIQKEELSEVEWFDFDDVIDKIKKQDTSTVFHENRLYLFDILKGLSE